MFQQSVADGVHRVEEAYTNWYLIEDGDSVTVVDAGFPKSWLTLRRVLAELDRSLGDIAALVLTHAHFDHVGFVRRFQREVGAPVYLNDLDRGIARHPLRYPHERSRLPYMKAGLRRVLPAMTAAGAPFVRGFQPDRTMSDGQVLDVPGRPRVVFSPGHTPGHCALHLPERGVLISADEIVTFDPYTGRPGPRVVARAATASVPLALSSLERLAEVDADIVLTGHGPPFMGPPAVAAAHAREVGVA
jgi:glyoxylase-like metal-dependent hydrolase (beta-lactamase superfamily II)